MFKTIVKKNEILWLKNHNICAILIFFSYNHKKDHDFCIIFNNNEWKNLSIRIIKHGQHTCGTPTSHACNSHCEEIMSFFPSEPRQNFQSFSIWYSNQLLSIKESWYSSQNIFSPLCSVVKQFLHHFHTSYIWEESTLTVSWLLIPSTS